VTANITIDSNSINNPVVKVATGTGIGAGGAVQVTPNPFTFPDTEAGLLSAEVTFTIKNAGTALMNVTVITPPAGFTVTVDPTPVAIAVGATAVFKAKFSPATAIYYTGNIALTNDTTVNPFNVAVAGLGIPLSPVFTVSGEEKVVIGLADFTTGDASVKLVNTVAACEEIATITKQFDFWFPEADFPIRGYDKSVLRLEIYYEDLGDFTLVASLTGKRYQSPLVPPFMQTLVVAGTSDQKTKQAIFDIEYTDEIQNLTLSCTAGKCSIVLILFSLEPGAEMVKDS